MKILYCNMNSLPPYHQSGAEITIDEFLEELFNKGYIVYSINSNEGALLRMQKYDEVKKNGMTIIHDPFCKVFYNSKDNFEERALNLISEINPDLIISQLNFLRPLARYCTIADKPLLYLIHGVHASGLNSDNDIECLRSPAVKGIETMALVGPSGVGKSTIINSLLGYEKQITSTYSIKSNKGRHTTTSRTLHYCSKLGAWAIDTPGIKELALWNVEKTPELFQHIYELAKECRFSNCSHIQEPGCRIKKALEDGTITRSEYEAFLKLERERQMVIATKRMCLRKKR